MSRLRKWGVPLLGLIGLTALFFKLPEVSFACKTCSPPDPYLPLIGAGYFAILIAISLLFPAFPNPRIAPRIARGGLLWAVSLAIGLTAIAWCPLCLVGHLCHISIWAIWCFAKRTATEPGLRSGERLCLLLFAPISVIALFSCLNLTFMAYGFKTHRSSIAALRAGDSIPHFSAKTVDGRTLQNLEKGTFLNFVAPNCPFCKEQLQMLQQTNTKRLINIAPRLTADLMEDARSADWIEDKQLELGKLFKVKGYPTLFVVGDDGKIGKVVLGVPESRAIDGF